MSIVQWVNRSNTEDYSNIRRIFIKNIIVSAKETNKTFTAAVPQTVIYCSRFVMTASNDTRTVTVTSTQWRIERKKWLGLNAFGRCSCPCCTAYRYILTESRPCTFSDPMLPVTTRLWNQSSCTHWPQLKPCLLNPNHPTKKLPLLDKNDTEQAQLSKRDRTMLIVTRYLS